MCRSGSRSIAGPLTGEGRRLGVVGDPGQDRLRVGDNRPVSELQRLRRQAGSVRCSFRSA